MNIPFFRPSISSDEIEEVVACLRSGWLTTGPRTKRFENEFAQYVGAKHAVGVNSATAALHLALEATGLKRGETVLVPTMTFAATAEVVRYFDAKPLLVDCREEDFNIDMADARFQAARAVERGETLRAIVPVHFGGQAVAMDEVGALARDFNLKIVEDAAHCCPAAYRDDEIAPWKKIGSEADVCCYSFYANKCITTGEGGMACTNDDGLSERMRIMSLHGMSANAWNRFSALGTWSYEIIAPGFKYNLTDIAAAIGVHQLKKADLFRAARARIADSYRQLLSDVAEIVLPTASPNRLHSWHLFVIRLCLDRLALDRGEVIEKLRAAGIGSSVHWIPLHMHPYYRETYGFAESSYPTASRISRETISLPIFPSMTDDEIKYVTDEFRKIIQGCRR